MTDNNYWIDFWNKNDIIHRSSVHEKVGRTIKGIPIDEDSWQNVLSDLEVHLELNSNDDLLDIAAGSGAIAIPFSKKIKSVTALDVSESLLSGMKDIPKINTLLADARNIEFENNQFSKIVLYFALQHFNEKETALLFQNIYKWLKPTGICFIGDIPDSEKTFSFFDNQEREEAYFNSILKDQPIIGTWFNKEFMQKLGAFVGFKHSILIEQPKNYINAHYRFDIKLIK